MTTARQRHYAPHEPLDLIELAKNVSVTYPDFNEDDFRAVDLAYAQQRDARSKLGTDFLRALDAQIERGSL